MNTNGAVEVDAVRSRIEGIQTLTARLSLARDQEELLRSQLAAALDEIAGLRVAMQTRAVIEQAKGMIMFAFGQDEQDAFEVLVRRSQETHVKLVDVARAVVQKRESMALTRDQRAEDHYGERAREWRHVKTGRRRTKEIPYGG